MPLPRIAIVGRPNVGKSSLLNMLARDKVSIVDPTPGVTRDRVSIIVSLEPPMQSKEELAAGGREIIRAEVTDTGGYGVYVAEGRRFDDVGADLTNLTKDIEFQIAEAVAGADLVLLVLDAQAGVTPQDEEIARLLRERFMRARKKPAAPASGAPDRARNPNILVVMNKTDGPRWEAHAYEAAGLGFGDPLAVSAKNNYFRRELLDRLYEEVDALDVPERADDGPQPEVRVAIIGKRNAGKSTLVNALAGEDRVIVSEIAGTTRDAIDVVFQHKNKTFMAIDTAGLRKKKSFADRVEWFAFERAQRAIARADVALLMVDATQTVSQVDQQLAMLCQKTFTPTVIVISKWDLVEGTVAKNGKEITPESYEKYILQEFKGLSFAPVSFMSATEGLNVGRTLDLAAELADQARSRAPTGELNRTLSQILATRGPSSKLGSFAKAYFIAQVATRPPTIVLVVNKPELFTANYRRFLMNRLREALPFPEVPIKLIIKPRKRRGEYHPDVDESTAPITPHPPTTAGRRGAPAATAGPRLRLVGAEMSAEDERELMEHIDEPFDLDNLPDDAEVYFED